MTRHYARKRNNMPQQTKSFPNRMFSENPFDLETVFESLSIASDCDKELIFMDMLLSSIRQYPHADLTTINYNILRELNILKLERT